MRAPMIGMIFECGPMGADKAVCEHFAGHIRPGAKLLCRTMDNKLNLLENAAQVAAALLEDGCERVLIVWDLRPAWPDKKKKPCRKIERDVLLDALAQQGLGAQPIYLVCVEQELESWLLADEVRLSDFLSTPTHRHKVSRVGKPDRVMQPKAQLINQFKAARGWRYEDYRHAAQVVAHGGGEPNWARLRRSDSFARFECKLK